MIRATRAINSSRVSAPGGIGEFVADPSTPKPVAGDPSRLGTALGKSHKLMVASDRFGAIAAVLGCFADEDVAAPAHDVRCVGRFVDADDTDTAPIPVSSFDDAHIRGKARERIDLPLDTDADLIHKLLTLGRLPSILSPVRWLPVMNPDEDPSAKGIRE